MEQPLTCAKCGRENRPGAVYCWECFAPFEGGAARPVAPVAPRPLVAVPAAQRPAPVPPEQVYRGPRTGQHARRFESAQPKRIVTFTSILRALSRLAMVGLLAVGGWYGYRWAGTFLGSGFPSEIAGVPRSLAGDDQLKAAIATWRSDEKVSARSQIYSSAINNNQDAFAVVRVTPVTGGASANELLRRLATAGTSVKLPASRVQHELVNGIDYTCATGFDQTTECLWQSAGGEVVIVMGGLSRDFGTTLTLTAAAHEAL